MFLRRRFSILFCFLAFLFLAAALPEATEKPPLHPINLNLASSTQFQEVPDWAGYGRQNAEYAQVVWAIQERGRFACNQGSWSGDRRENQFTEGHCAGPYCPETARRADKKP